MIWILGVVAYLAAADMNVRYAMRTRKLQSNSMYDANNDDHSYD